MTAQHDLDRALAGWFSEEAMAAPPPEPLARALESTRALRPRPALTASIGSSWVGAGSSIGLLDGVSGRRPVVAIALVALLALALAGAALLVGGRLPAPPPVSHVYADELVSAPDLSLPMAHPVLAPLPDGRVLVIGDDGSGGGTGTRALVYDPATGVSAPTGPLVSGDTLLAQSAVRLQDARVLVLGNDQEIGVTQIFDPETQRFSPVGPMNTPRSFGAAAAVLPDGHVLIAGGDPTGGNGATSSAELLDPDTLTFASTGSMTTSRSGHSMVVLPDGRVFVSPGDSRTSVEIYDPETGTFSVAGTMSSYFHGDTAIALPDGRVAVLGGSSLSAQGFLDVWDPGSLTFSPGCRPHPCPLLSDGGLLEAAEGTLPGRITSATPLDDGRILLIGETRSRGTWWSGVYDPATGQTTATQPPRAGTPTATRLPDGRVLIVGGTLPERQGPGGSEFPGASTVEVFQ